MKTARKSGRPLGEGKPYRSQPSGFLFAGGIVAVAAIYFVAAKVGLKMAFTAEQVSPVWPPTGIAMAVLLLGGPRFWPGIALGAFLANVTASEPFATALGIATGNTLEALAATWLLQRPVRFARSFERLSDVLAFVVLAAAASTTVSATIGVTSLCLGGVQPWASFAPLWWTWWLGDATGALFIAPLLLTWLSCPVGRWPGWRIAEAAALLVSLVGTALIVFVGTLDRATSHHSLEYTIFPFVIWAALRFGQPGGTLVTFFASSLAIWGTVHDLGPFTEGSSHENLLMLQTFLAVVAITALLLGAAIRERDIAEEAVVEAGRRKDEFLALLAHELRNPLAPIRNGLQIMHLARGNAPMIEQARGLMERQVEQMVRLIDDLLDVSRISRGKLRLRKERIELAVAMRSAVETCRPLFEAAALELTVVLPGEAVYLEADLTRLTQVLTNLLNNAVKFTPSGGHVWLSAERQKGEAVVRVRDTGIGIPADKLPRIFDLFTQVDSSLEKSRGGLGVGLTLVKRLVEMHGGTVAAHSEGNGQGSELVVRLPVLGPSEPEEPSRPTKTVSPGYPGCRILVADDNRDAADSLAAMLRITGNEVCTAYDGQEAFAAAEAVRPHLILLDIGMPKLNGYAVAQRIREQVWGSEVTLVALTGWSQPEDKRRAQAAGFNHHMAKPVDPPALESFLVELKRRLGILTS